VIIVLVGLFLYFLIGFLILKFGQHKEGRECVPQHEFWLGLPGLVIDGVSKKMICIVSSFSIRICCAVEIYVRQERFLLDLLLLNIRTQRFCCVPCRGSSYTEV
jgi:hypothetical protein